ncbi:MAG: hypothetical protein IJ563_08625 [Selenomonadaceae bacterium]|nr:hypothetical protein [Selenomonadaceae bacterium]
MKKICFLMIAALALGITGSGCGKEDMPEDALKDIQVAIAKQDKELLATRVDVDKFLDMTYNDVTEAIANNVGELHNRYPDDPYFWNTPQFIRTYNDSHRNFYMSFVNASVNAYFDPNVKLDSFINIFAIQCANEFKNLCAAMNTKIINTKVEGSHAFVDFEVKGDSTHYGQFVGDMTFKFKFEKDDSGRWRLSKIENIDELIYPLVDRAELVWPETIM